ncbi:shikimate dehydrogenase [Corynebacterium sp. P5875]|uniref:Shikimate dehydrogenase n=1 Tax=Corynebacterium antarcticum TaxID=2800405 RepID=A0A9Q4CA12_9CORY|nr:shikimate dehydrogenase [Corynebacterium antarcticum]MCX7537135.1 shikimate dehydrogenase [Corynebacterium antarcticum]
MSDPIRHRAAVLGRPVEHSLSPVIHMAGYRAIGLDDWCYTRIDCGANDVRRIVSDAPAEFAGFSVTMPGKFAALDVAREVTPRAAAIGSANTLVRIAGGWRADNTDCEGVSAALGDLGVRNPAAGERAVLVGAGGTARPALWALGQSGYRAVTVINRSDRSAELAPLAETLGIELHWTVPDRDRVRAAVRDAAVVISTVPAAALDGIEGDLARVPVLDVIYDPWPTPLARAAAGNGVPVVGGDVMLAGQALSQFEQFTGEPAPRDAMRAALTDALRDRSSGS